MGKFTIIISTFNEEKTIPECLERVWKAAPAAEIILIHGGKDRTADIAAEWGRERSIPIRVFKNYGDSGKGHAIKLGITLASHPAMLQFDADLQFVPEDIPRVIRPVLEGEADLAIGSRFMDGADKSGYRSNFFRDKGNTFLNRFISCLTGQAVTDVTTGLKAWNRKAIWDIDFKDNRFIYEMEIVVRGALKGYRIVQVPVTYFSRQGGASGHGTGLKEFYSIAKTGLMIALKACLIRCRLW
ncbi:MAG: glycosyltransferase family 2 protein [Candidatus Euphemobacter frigidus]|nr:glycosyltransferase family 2 protein [Candidatus Euphemobacter frigidus]